MICYRDMTFCPYSLCKNFGETCFRSLTPEVEAAAREWWGGENAPIALFAEKPSCYERRAGEKI